MQQLLMKLRVRPARVVVLMDRLAGTEQLVQVLRFFSQLWGGRYCYVIPVDGNKPDPLTLFRLRSLRPEFVYGKGIDDAKWRSEVVSACQPRMFGALDERVAEDVRQALLEGFIRGDQAVVAMFQARDGRSHFYRPLTVVSADQGSDLSLFCAAMFGIHPSGLREEYADERRELDASAPAVDFIKLCADIFRNNKQTWLDANSFGLSTAQIDTPTAEPVIVLVRDVVSDLSLFWNERMTNSRAGPAWAIPVPANQVDNQAVVDALKEWLNGFNPMSNYCVVTSESLDKEECSTFAAKLAEAMDGTSIRYVDYAPARNRLPLVVPAERPITWPVSIDGRKVQLVPPKPKTFQPVSNAGYWYVDLVQDARTRRALLDMQLPGSTIVPDILNGPCPPTYEHAAIKRFADGVDSINVRCNSAKPVVDLYVPSPEEVLEEVLHEGGYEPVHDEKRSSYLPTIERFGSLYEAAKAFSGETGEILECFHREGTLVPNEIRGYCRLGGGEIPGDDYLARVEQFLASEREKRVARRRFAEFIRGEVPESLKLGPVLEHWTDRAILTRRWQLGPCSHCRQTRFIEELSIQQPLLCQNCGHRMLLPERPCIAYALTPPVAHSIDEGIVPVVLTGRFLHNMTNQGFFWLPGAKFKRGEDGGDADVIACCDGYLVFAECKTLSEIPGGAEVWEDVVTQFLQLAEVAMRCRADLAVLACRVGQYPDNVRQQVDDRLKNQIPYILLDRNDLETGHRRTEDGMRLQIPDLVSHEFPESRTEQKGKPRQIRFSAMTYTKGR